MSLASVRRIAAMIVAAGLTLGAGAAQAAEFLVKGTTLDGAPYTGKVVTDVAGDTVKVVWNIDGQRYLGNGVIYQDALAIYYTGNLTGVALYKRDPNTGVLRGRWTSGNSNKIGTEEWTPVP